MDCRGVYAAENIFGGTSLQFYLFLAFRVSPLHIEDSKRSTFLRVGGKLLHMQGFCF